MEFKLNSKTLEKLLSKVIPAVPSRTPMPILENFLFDIKDGMLTVSSTDLEIALKSSINAAADQNIKMVVPAKLLYDITRSLGDVQIQFKTEGNSKLVLNTESGVYNLSFTSPEDFPDIPVVNKEKEITLGGNEFIKPKLYQDLPNTLFITILNIMPNISENILFLISM